eukprot:scaffold245121_cov18-Prasinocladus_malaysianus.AAC.2
MERQAGANNNCLPPSLEDPAGSRWTDKLRGEVGLAAVCLAAVLVRPDGSGIAAPTTRTKAEAVGYTPEHFTRADEAYLGTIVFTNASCQIKSARRQHGEPKSQRTDRASSVILCFFFLLSISRSCHSAMSRDDAAHSNRCPEGRLNLYYSLCTNQPRTHVKSPD